MTDDRIEKLEIALAHAERQIQDLSEIAARQTGEIEVLQRRLDRTQNKIRDLDVGSGSEAAATLSVAEQAARDKPPHY